MSALPPPPQSGPPGSERVAPSASQRDAARDRAENPLFSAFSSLEGVPRGAPGRERKNRSIEFGLGVRDGVTPVTNAHYRRFLLATEMSPRFLRRSTSGSRSARGGVSFDQALRYCAGSRRKRGYRSGFPPKRSVRRPLAAESLGRYSRGAMTRLPEDTEPLAARFPVRTESDPRLRTGTASFTWRTRFTSGASTPTFPTTIPSLPRPILRFGSGRRSARGSWRHALVVTPCAARSCLSLVPYADFGFRWSWRRDLLGHVGLQLQEWSAPSTRGKPPRGFLLLRRSSRASRSITLPEIPPDGQDQSGPTQPRGFKFSFKMHQSVTPCRASRTWAPRSGLHG
jgi:hypothetical protein